MKSLFHILMVGCFSLLIILIASCNKEGTTPPYHKNIFRCKVNGVEWNASCPSSGLFGCEPIDCQYYWKEDKAIEFSVLRRNDDDTIYESIAFLARPVNSDSNFSIYPLENNYFNINKLPGCKFYTIDTSFAYHLTILEVDTVNFLVKGNFEYTALNDCNDTVRITDGFFHVNFRF